jgi:hypothetical protein
MKTLKWIQALFALAALYDGVLGVVFLVAPAWAYGQVGVTPPNHWGYVRFPAALLIVFTLMFAAIAADPVRNRNLIPYGIGLKVSYCAVTIGYWVTAGVPGIWKPFAVIDLAMIALFAWAWVTLGSARQAPGPAASTAEANA